jgi:hypothetical protein
MTVEAIRPELQPGAYVREAGKLMRIASVARAMLAEAQDTPCDEAGCERFRTIYERTIEELNSLLSSDLRSELDHLTETFAKESPSPSELRIAQAELVGWLEGLFHGISAAAVDQAEGAATQAESIVGASDASIRTGQYL